MFAVIKTGGKQYTVAADKEITVMSLPGEAGAQVVFNEVLALFDGETNTIGAPHVAGASVTGEIVEQARGPKVYRLQEAAPQEFEAQARPPAGPDDRQDHRHPAGRLRQASNERIPSFGLLRYKGFNFAALGRGASDRFGAGQWLTRRQAVRRATVATPTAAVSA